MNGYNNEFGDVVGRGYPWYELMGRGPAPQQQAFDQMGDVGQSTYQLGYPVTGSYPCALPGGGVGGGSDGVLGMPSVMGGPAGEAPFCGLGAPVSPFYNQPVQEPATFLRPRIPRYIRTEPLGFGCACIPAGASEEFSVSVETLTKIIRFVIPSSVAFQLVVEDIIVGRESLISSGPVTAAMFVEDGTGPSTIATETIQEGTCVTIRLRNISNQDVEVCPSAWARVLVY